MCFFGTKFFKSVLALHLTYSFTFVEKLFRGEIKLIFGPSDISVLFILFKLLFYFNFNPKKNSKINEFNNLENNFRFFVKDVFIEFQNKNLLLETIKKYKRVIHIFCLNPGFGFNKILNEGPYSIKITSGTLSPIIELESEFKTFFKYKLEGGHIINFLNLALGWL